MTLLEAIFPNSRALLNQPTNQPNKMDPVTQHLPISHAPTQQDAEWNEFIATVTKHLPISHAPTANPGIEIADTFSGTERFQDAVEKAKKTWWWQIWDLFELFALIASVIFIIGFVGDIALHVLAFGIHFAEWLSGGQPLIIYPK